MRRCALLGVAAKSSGVRKLDASGPGDNGGRTTSVVELLRAPVHREVHQCLTGGGKQPAWIGRGGRSDHGAHALQRLVLLDTLRPQGGEVAAERIAQRIE